ncbi:MAG: hypothetical protein IIA41_06525 [SAR324 cluster bacterium]|nr:hypothetical protein [SAR324 cluster bacterium]
MTLLRRRARRQTRGSRGRGLQRREGRARFALLPLAITVLQAITGPQAMAAPQIIAARLGMAARLILATALAAAIGGGCMAMEDELDGPLGPGQGGPTVDTAALEQHDLTAADGQIIGVLQFDPGYYFHFHFRPYPMADVRHILATITGDVLLTITRIVGRPDTPCRFQAAVLARDEGYEILGSGDRTNDRGLEFHQVNLENERLPAAQRFYCAKLHQRIGVQISVFSVLEEVQEYLQVHFVLNSTDRT